MHKRIQPQAGEWIDRTKPISFNFEGKQYQAFEGDTISSALIANGEHILGRSFKYHRPRGVLSFANHDVNVLMTDGIDTNIRADITLVKQGMQLAAVNTSGGVKHDKKRWLDKISALLPVGFYYKAFHRPKKLFPFWENIIRKSAGLGVVNFNFPHQIKHKTHQHVDVLVVGAGAAGLNAAIFAAKSGITVLLVDENHRLGGSLNEDFAGAEEAKAVREQLLNALKNYPNITCIANAYVAGYYTDHFLPVITENGMIKVRAKSLIVATGAFEQPPVFRNNDLPGVMLSTAVQKLMHRYAVMPFQHGLVFTANHQGYRAALDMLKAGIKVTHLVDLRKNPQAALAAELIQKGVTIYTGYCVYEALPDAKNLTVKAAIICPYDEVTALPDSTKAITLACDGIAMSAGWSPAAALLYQAGTHMRYDDMTQQFMPEKLPAGVFSAGKVNGVFALKNCLLDGERAANEALRYLNIPAPEMTVECHMGESASHPYPSHPYPIVPHPKGKNFIDFDEDIQLKDFINAAQEGFDNIELMKRFTTVGMGPSQGKHSNMNAIRILARIRNLPIAKVGSTTSRPFYHPTPMGHLAGHRLHPYRLTAMHDWHVNHGAELSQVGNWMRPAYYQQAGRTKNQCIQQEVLAVRKTAGLIDVSTLGKIELHGPQAALFLERFYTGLFINQQIGTTRYALALDESGVMMDDGIVARLAEDCFYITCSTSNLAIVYREMQRWQQVWQLDVGLINVTSAYAAMNIAGQSATKILSTLLIPDVENKPLTLGDVREMVIADTKARVISVGFVSGSAYEIHVPVNHALSVWEALIAAGQADKLQPFGTEAQRLLRLEMGHPLIGHDTDGLTNPFEANATFALNMDKPFFIGQRSLQIIQKKTLNKKLVAFTLDAQSTDSANAAQHPQECNLVIAEDEITGRVTSVAISPTLQRPIGLAYLHPRQTEIGTPFFIRTDNGRLVKATVVRTPFVKLQPAEIAA